VSGLTRTWLDAFRGNGPETSLDRHLKTLPLFHAFSTATQTFRLTGKILKVVVTPPFSWVREAVVETSKAYRLAFIPVMFASTVYVLAFGSFLFGEVIYALGAPDRLTPGFYLGILRELGTWLTYMIMAASVGSALAGDLGARKIREELDALDVLGVDKIRDLIVPRAIALTVVGTTLALVSLLVNVFCAIMINSITVNQTIGSQVSSVLLVMNPYDLIASLIKHAIIGFFIGVVACQKGLSARGGAEGVGRAVSETVLITFFGLWLINTVFNTAYLTVFPGVIDIRG
jgi:phospholipid/cholesterol/gamma-HCH transport system permease protein